MPNLKGFGERTTIVLKRQTRDNLAKLGSKDQTFDQIVQELIRRTADCR
jgi:hypothetical protein